MTKAENERLGIVETKVDAMRKDIEVMNTSLCDKIDVQEKNIGAAMSAQERNIGTAMTASEKAIVKAELANDLRFEAMNKRITESIEAINANIKTLTERENLDTGAKKGVKDFQSWITWLIVIAGFIITYFVSRGGI